MSSNYDCAILSASNTNLLVVKFTADVTLVEDLIATDFLDVANWADADAAVAKSYQVSDDCSAFSADSGTYHFDDSITAGGATKFVPDDATTWTAPVFSSDFNFAAANDGIYKYTPKTADDPGMYSRVHSVTLLANKRIWTTATAIIIVSWASTGTDDMKDYKVHSFLRPTGIQTVYTLVGSIEG